VGLNEANWTWTGADTVRLGVGGVDVVSLGHVFVGGLCLADVDVDHYVACAFCGHLCVCVYCGEAVESCPWGGRLRAEKKTMKYGLLGYLQYKSKAI
jgi:hypothetical protein